MGWSAQSHMMGGNLLGHSIQTMVSPLENALHMSLNGGRSQSGIQTTTHASQVSASSTEDQHKHAGMGFSVPIPILGGQLGGDFSLNSACSSGAQLSLGGSTSGVSQGSVNTTHHQASHAGMQAGMGLTVPIPILGGQVGLDSSAGTKGAHLSLNASPPSVKPTTQQSQGSANGAHVQGMMHGGMHAGMGLSLPIPIIGGQVGVDLGAGKGGAHLSLSATPPCAQTSTTQAHEEDGHAGVHGGLGLTVPIPILGGQVGGELSAGKGGAHLSLGVAPPTGIQMTTQGSAVPAIAAHVEHLQEDLQAGLDWTLPICMVGGDEVDDVQAELDGAAAGGIQTSVNGNWTGVQTTTTVPQVSQSAVSTGGQGTQAGVTAGVDSAVSIHVVGGQGGGGSTFELNGGTVKPVVPLLVDSGWAGIKTTTQSSQDSATCTTTGQPKSDIVVDVGSALGIQMIGRHDGNGASSTGGAQLSLTGVQTSQVSAATVTGQGEHHQQQGHGLAIGGALTGGAQVSLTGSLPRVEATTTTSTQQSSPQVSAAIGTGQGEHHQHQGNGLAIGGALTGGVQVSLTGSLPSVEATTTTTQQSSPQVSTATVTGQGEHHQQQGNGLAIGGALTGGAQVSLTGSLPRVEATTTTQQSSPQVSAAIGTAPIGGQGAGRLELSGGAGKDGAQPSPQPSQVSATCTADAHADTGSVMTVHVLNHEGGNFNPNGAAAEVGTHQSQTITTQSSHDVSAISVCDEDMQAGRGPTVPIQMIGGQGGRQLQLNGSGNGGILKRIRVWAGAWMIRGVHVELSNGQSGMFGHEELDAHDFIFSPGELIQSLSLWDNGEGARVGAIKFSTSQGREFFAKMTHRPLTTEYKIDVGSGICVGLLAKCGVYIHSMGFLFLKLIKTCQLENVRYPTLATSHPRVRMITIDSQELTNRCTDEVREFRYEVRTQKLGYKQSWSQTTGFQSVVSCKIKAGLPQLVENHVGFYFTESGTTVHARELEQDRVELCKVSVKVQPCRRVRAHTMMGNVEVSLPFTATMVANLTDGSVLSFDVNGMYEGITYTGKLEVEDMGPADSVRTVLPCAGSLSLESLPVLLNVDHKLSTPTRSVPLLQTLCAK